MRTTLDLDRRLLEEAKRVLDAASYTEAIETALREVVGRARARSAWETLIGSEVSWGSVDDLLVYRRRYGGRPL